jgi:glycosyltransferase involved in cell wall biosynthesis
MTDSKPLVTVLLPINRTHEYLENAINSLREQDYPNFEVLILDNSEDGLELVQLPKNFFVHKLPGGAGLSKALNFGIEIAEGKYIFRMDSDDIAVANRLSTQVRYLEENVTVDILGSGIEIIGTGENRNVSIGNILDRTIANGKVSEFLLYKNPLFHPTVAMRAESIRTLSHFYNSRYDCVEDLDLWMRASRTLRIENIPDILLKYRIHDKQMGRTLASKSEFYSNLIRVRHSFWLISHGIGIRKKATKALFRSLDKLVRSSPAYFLLVLRNQSRLKKAK